MNLEWNVYYHNVNAKRIQKYNIFNHYSFKNDVEEYLRVFKPKNNKEEFKTALISSLFYFFWSKAEYEVVICPWVGGDREKEAVKIDVYNQVMLNFDIFVDYIWNSVN